MTQLFVKAEPFDYNEKISITFELPETLTHTRFRTFFIAQAMSPAIGFYPAMSAEEVVKWLRDVANTLDRALEARK